MLFNSIDFALFLPLVFIVYWFVANKNVKSQNLLIFFSSYIFYAWWDWRFLSLLLLSTVADYFVGLKLSENKNPFHRKMLLWTSILVNIGLLAFFKYYNFFLENFIHAFSFFGYEIKVSGLNIVLPVGISFYTFQTLSYTIDIYREKIKPTKDFIAFAAFVSFFPQLVAGPIERAKNLLPQFYIKRAFNYERAIHGLRQILWGLFKKVVIADRCGEHADFIFNHSMELNGSTLFLGALFFAFQIYGDFSGYSDIAIGTSRLFGIDLKKNFAFPYFSRDIAEFWRRWHISLTSWFKDYVYIPLGGSKGGTCMTTRNIFIVFIISGLWHGANWTFIVWGLLNALCFLPLLFMNNNRRNLNIVAQGKSVPSIRELSEIILTFCLTILIWVLFRSENLDQAFDFYSGIFSLSLFSMPHFIGMKRALVTVFLILFFVSLEWMERDRDFALATLGLKWQKHSRWLFYYVLIVAIFYFSGQQQAFIYFQF